MLTNSIFSFSYNVFRHQKFCHGLNSQPFATKSGFFTTASKVFEKKKKNVGKRENTGSQHFLPFSTMFSTYSKSDVNFQSNSFCGRKHSNALTLDQKNNKK